MCSCAHTTFLLRYSFATRSRMLKAHTRLMQQALKIFCHSAEEMARLASASNAFSIASHRCMQTMPQRRQCFCVGSAGWWRMCTCCM